MRAPTHWLARLRADGSATHLAVIRVLFGVHLLDVFLSPVLPLIAEVQPPPHPLASLAVPGALADLVTPEIFLAARAVGVAAVLAMILGAFTRVAVVVVTAAFFVTQMVWFRHSVFHDDWLYFGFHLLVLCFARPGDAWAIDAWWARRRGRPLAPAQTYRWPVEMMIGWVAFLYFAAGLAKILPLRKGLLWLDGASAQTFAGEFALDGPLYWLLGGELAFDYTVRWPWVVASVGTVVVELGAVAFLLSRRAYLPLLVTLFGMHVSIYLLGVPAFVQIFVVQLVLFLPPERLRRFDPAVRPAPR